MNARAAEREMRIFAHFAKAAPIDVLPDTVQSRSHPEPDILCQLKTGETVAFELVELIDEGYARATSDQHKTKVMLDGLPERLPGGCKAGLTKLFPGGAHISFDFVPQLAVRQREQAAIAALRWIVDQGHVNGHFSPEGDLATRVQIVHVHPWKGGLQFDAGLFTRLGDPTLDRLAAKFRKPYVSQHQIELLMYTEVDLLYPGDVWKPAVEPYVQNNLAASRFRRVWLFKAGRGVIEYVYPALA